MVRFWLTNFLRIQFVAVAILVSGCVINPKYETADAQHQKELEQNPHFKQKINDYETDKKNNYSTKHFIKITTIICHHIKSPPLAEKGGL